MRNSDRHMLIASTEGVYTYDSRRKVRLYRGLRRKLSNHVICGAVAVP